MNDELKNVRLGAIPLRLVVTDCDEGTMTRYEARDGNRRRTHFAKADDDYERPVEFTPEVVNEFRLHADGEFSVTGPAPIPGGDDPGGTPAAAKAAA